MADGVRSVSPVEVDAQMVPPRAVQLAECEGNRDESAFLETTIRKYVAEEVAHDECSINSPSLSSIEQLSQISDDRIANEPDLSVCGEEIDNRTANRLKIFQGENPDEGNNQGVHDKNSYVQTYPLYQTEKEHSENAADHVEHQTEMDNTPFHILKPGPEWALNLLLNDISRSIDRDDFERLKMLFRCDKLFGKKVLEQMKTAFDMFTLMKERMMINCNDIVWLQVALYHIGKVDLLQKCVHYAKESSDCLHFFSPTFKPENGFKFVKIHLAGPDMKKKSKTVIDDLKTTIKNLLGIPTNFICIVGVEPTESLLITVMMPDMYVDWLQSVLEAEEHIIDPYNLQIDMIVIRDRVYNVQCTSAEVKMDIQKNQQGDFNINSQFKDYQEMKYQRDEIEKKMLMALKQLKIQEKHVGEITDIVQKAFSNTADDLSLQKGREKTLHVFSELLQVCCDRQYDVRLIQQLLTDHLGIIRSEMTIQFLHKEAELVLKVRSLEAQILQMERRLLMCQKLHHGMQTIPDKIQMMQQVSVAFSFNIREEVLSVLREICDELTDKDMETIRERYTWNPNENVTKLAKTKEEFLHGVVEKEVTDRNAVLNGNELESFLFGLFDLIGKEGLKEKFQRLMKAQETSLQTSDRRLLLEINKKMTDLHSAFQGKIPSEVAMFNEKILDYTAASNPIQYHSPGK